MSDITRRDLLKTSLPVIAGVSLGFGCGGGASIPSTTVSAGPSSQIAMGVQQLAEYDVFLVRTEQGLAAISGQCTHAGCGVEPVEGGFHCGCHGSEFSADGSVTNGPANEPLPWYEVRVEGGEVTVDPTSPVPQGTWVAI